MEKSRLIWLNSLNTLVGSLWVSLSLIFGIIFVSSVESDRTYYATLVLIYLTVFGGLLLAGLVSMPKWFIFVRKVGEDLYYHQAFHKKKKLPLDSYRYIYRCVKSSSGYRAKERGPYYIVLSQGPMSHYEVTHVDHLQGSVELIKIKYTKKSVNAVFHLLNNAQKDVLVKVFGNSVEDIRIK